MSISLDNKMASRDNPRGDGIDLQETVLIMRDKLAEASAFIKKVTSPPFIYGTVVKLNDDSVDVEVGGKVMEVNINPRIELDQITPGVPVRLSPETFSIIGVMRVNLCNRFDIYMGCSALDNSDSEGCLFVVGPTKESRQNNKDIQK